MAYKKVPLFTARVIDSARAGDILTEAGSPGLRLRVSDSGSRSWLYRYNAGDGKKQITFGAYPQVGIADARMKWSELRAARKAGENVAVTVRADRSKAVAQAGVTIGMMADDYLTGHIDQRRKPKGAAETRRLFKGYVYPMIGDALASAFEVPDAVRYLRKVKAKSLASARVLRGELRAMWRRSLESGMTRSPNPFSDIMKGDLPQIRSSRWLDDGELKKWFRWLVDSPCSPDVKHALELTLRTACRSGEIVALPWANVDLKQGLLILRETKTGSQRVVRLPKPALDILKARHKSRERGAEFVFPSPIEGRHIRQHALVWAISNYSGDSGIPKWSAHDLRRTARTHFSRLGIPEVVAEAALGHSRVGVSAHYNLHQYEAEVGDALKKWNAHIDAIRSAR